AFPSPPLVPASSGTGRRGAEAPASGACPCVGAAPAEPRNWLISAFVSLLPPQVILILTKYYHADMGKVLESSLWRSSDFGTSYTKLTLQPGVTTVIDNFYICPTNKRKVVLVSSSLSDRDQSLFLSTDEGATFQKQLVPFSVETLIFHPKEEDKVLAYSKESTLYVSSDLGKRWTLLRERVTKDHVFWAVSGVDTDPDLVHMETQDLGGGFRYVTCRIHNCSDKTLTALFPGHIDHSSLTVQDDYIFFKATATNRTKYYVSYRRNEFVPMKLPKYALPQVRGVPRARPRGQVPTRAAPSASATVPPAATLLARCPLRPHVRPAPSGLRASFRPQGAGDPPHPSPPFIWGLQTRGSFCSTHLCIPAA
uniref:VPS10 domain-containing protein n=1 Tax=Lynx canadensis TaxID=61383 RepID=A0A667FP49_LYNCA